jgi:hypothetical protein
MDKGPPCHGNPRVVTETGCWEWTGARSETGYGVISIEGRLNDEKNEEQFVTRLAPILHSVLKENGFWPCAHSRKA